MTADLIATAAIIIGFGVTVIMFRVQRELYVFEVLKVRNLWLAWADYLVLAAVAVATFGVVTPLLIAPSSAAVLRVARSLCAAATVLLSGFIPAILAHYRIELGRHREGPRAKGEPLERVAVSTTCVLALVVFWVAVCQ